MRCSLIVGSVVILYTLKKIEYENLNTNIKKKVKILKYKTIGVLLWPLIFNLIIPEDEKYKNSLIAPFLWPFFVWIWDSYLLTYGLISETSSSNVVSARLDPSTISSMSFALFGLLGGSSNGKYSYIFLYAVLMCIAFVFPNHNLASGSPEDILVESVQKVILSWAVGMLFVGVSLQHFSQKNKSNDVNI